MGHNPKKNEEDISDIDDIFDDNKDNIDKFPNADRSSATDSDLVVEEDEEPGRDTIEEEGETGEEIRGEAEGGHEEESDVNTRTVTTTAPTTAKPSTNESEGATSTSASTSASIVAPSPTSDSKFYAIRTTGGQERVVANVLQNKIKSKNIGIYSILLLENFKGYIIVEAPDANVAFQALAGVRHIRGQIRGELPFKDIEGYLVKKPVVTELSVDDTVEVIGGPFKAMKAKITRVDYEKQEATVVLLDSPYQIPVTVDANYLKKVIH
jgi:transcription termination/antitermination protein NusG